MKNHDQVFVISSPLERGSLMNDDAKVRKVEPSRVSWKASQSHGEAMRGRDGARDEQ